MPQNLAQANGVLTPSSVREASVETLGRAPCELKKRSTARRSAKQRSNLGGIPMGLEVWGRGV